MTHALRISEPHRLDLVCSKLHMLPNKIELSPRTIGRMTIVCSQLSGSIATVVAEYEQPMPIGFRSLYAVSEVPGQAPF